MAEPGTKILLVYRYLVYNNLDKHNNYKFTDSCRRSGDIEVYTTLRPCVVGGWYLPRCDGTNGSKITLPLPLPYYYYYYYYYYHYHYHYHYRYHHH